MVDKVIIGAVLVGGAAKVLAQVASDVPGLEGWANLTATGALIYLVVYIITKTIPRMVENFREEASKSRDVFTESLKDIREVFVCHQHAEMPATVERIEQRQIALGKMQQDTKSKVEAIHAQTVEQGVGSMRTQVKGLSDKLGR